MSALATQAEAFAQLPATLTALNRAVWALTESIGQARETVQRVNRVTAQAEAMLSTLEAPILALAPGLERLAAVLDDDVIDTVPVTLRRITDDVLPVVRQLRETQDRIFAMAASTDRIMHFVEDTGTRLGTIPGAGLLGFRRGAPPSPPVRPAETDSPQ